MHWSSPPEFSSQWEKIHCGFQHSSQLISRSQLLWKAIGCPEERGPKKKPLDGPSYSVINGKYERTVILLPFNEQGTRPDFFHVCRVCAFGLLFSLCPQHFLKYPPHSCRSIRQVFPFMPN